MILAFSSIPVFAELHKLNDSVISDSEEPFSRRIYSYDFDISDDGIIHAIYSKPKPGTNRAQVIYMSKPIGGEWPAENKRIVLEENGLLNSISTWLIYDNKNKVAHVSYIVEKPFVDLGVLLGNGVIYQTIANNIPGKQVNISSGEFHTRMQLDKNQQPIFAREYEVFLKPDGTIRQPPFPKALRLHLPTGNGTWTNREHILNLPPAEDYRLSNFVYDPIKNRYHLTYGNKDAHKLRVQYPTTNPPLTNNSTPVFFPPGQGHQLIYAYSDNLSTWKTSTIDPSGDISENEFWSDLILDRQGKPYAASFRYKTDAQGVQQGSTGIFGSFNNEAWSIATVAGKTKGATEHRAGAAAKIVLDDEGGFHGVWDNSPDAPIDSESPNGTTMYHYSPDGQNWETRQMILPFSVEGPCRVKIYNNKLYLMVLSDYKDAKLVFAEYQLPFPGSDLMEVSTNKMFYGSGETIQFHVRMQGKLPHLSNLYLIAAGPYNVDSTGKLIELETTRYHYLDQNLQWQTITDLANAAPAAMNYQLINYSGFFIEAEAAISKAFAHPGRYRLYSFASLAGEESTISKAISPWYTKSVSPWYISDIHVCNKAQCADQIEK